MGLSESGRFVGRRTIRGSLGRIVGLAVLGLGGFAALAFDTLSLLEVNGPLYDEVIQGKDIVADVLPPPHTWSSRTLSFTRCWNSRIQSRCPVSVPA